MIFNNGKLVEITKTERAEIRSLVFDSGCLADAQHRITRYLIDKGQTPLFSRASSFHVMMVVLCGYSYCKEVGNSDEKTV